MTRGFKKGDSFDELLIAAGRKPYTKGLGLDSLGVGLKANGAIIVDKYLRTKFPNIYAVGDVTGSFQYTHAASHMAWHASVNSLFSFIKKISGRLSFHALRNLFSSRDCKGRAKRERSFWASNMTSQPTIYQILIEQ